MPVQDPYYQKRAADYMRQRGRPYPASTDRAADLAAGMPGSSLTQLEQQHGYQRPGVAPQVAPQVAALQQTLARGPGFGAGVMGPIEMPEGTSTGTNTGRPAPMLTPVSSSGGPVAQLAQTLRRGSDQPPLDTHERLVAIQNAAAQGRLPVDPPRLGVAGNIPSDSARAPRMFQPPVVRGGLPLPANPGAPDYNYGNPYSTGVPYAGTESHAIGGAAGIDPAARQRLAGQQQIAAAQQANMSPAEKLRRTLTGEDLSGAWGQMNSVDPTQQARGRGILSLAGEGDLRPVTGMPKFDAQGQMIGRVGTPMQVTLDRIAANKAAAGGNQVPTNLRDASNPRWANYLAKQHGLQQGYLTPSGPYNTPNPNLAALNPRAFQQAKQAELGQMTAAAQFKPGGLQPKDVAALAHSETQRLIGLGVGQEQAIQQGIAYAQRMAAGMGGPNQLLGNQGGALGGNGGGIVRPAGPGAAGPAPGVQPVGLKSQDAIDGMPAGEAKDNAQIQRWANDGVLNEKVEDRLDGIYKRASEGTWFGSDFDDFAERVENEGMPRSIAEKYWDLHHRARDKSPAPKGVNRPAAGVPDPSLTAF